MLAGFKSLYEETLPALLLLMDVDSLEGTLPRSDERHSGDRADDGCESPGGHGGLVTGHETGLSDFVSLESL
jgi:hypothetical protein